LQHAVAASRPDVTTTANRDHARESCRSVEALPVLAFEPAEPETGRVWGCASIACRGVQRHDPDLAWQTASGISRPEPGRGDSRRLVAGRTDTDGLP
jgi:hypothetical protein